MSTMNTLNVLKVDGTLLDAHTVARALVRSEVLDVGDHISVNGNTVFIEAYMVKGEPHSEYVNIVTRRSVSRY